MATSSMAVDTGVIVEFADLVANDPDDLDTNFDEYTTKFNAMLETTSGHNHNATNSRLAIVGGTSVTSADLMKMLIGRGRI